jgi:hypothetical protein
VKRLSIGIFLLLVGILTGGAVILGVSQAEAVDRLAANAGPDQKVYLPAPVRVQFDGTGSQTGSYEIVSYKWYNQWGTFQAEGPTPAFDVHFGLLDGKEPKPGMTRSFKLVVTDANGDKAHDWVKITVADPWRKHAGTVTVTRGDVGDYTFSNYQVDYAFNRDEGVVTETIQGGIIDTEGQDYAYIFYYTNAEGGPG